MNVIALISLIVTLLEGVATGLGKSGLAEEAQGIQAAIDALQRVSGSMITKVQVDSFKITPQW
jgi:hypothetical protein